MKEMKTVAKLDVVNKYLFFELITLMLGFMLMEDCLFSGIPLLAGIGAAVVVICVIIVAWLGVLEYRENEVNFCMLRNGAKMPEKRLEDAGYDIYACFDDSFIVINPDETKMVPTGIASTFNSKFVAVLKERGSTGTKGIGQRAGVIDSGYRGEWMVPLTNHNDQPLVIVKENGIDEFKNYIKELIWDYEDYIIYPYEKAIAQMLLLPVPCVKVSEIDHDKLVDNVSLRGSGKLGSSGK